MLVHYDNLPHADLSQSNENIRKMFAESNHWQLRDLFELDHKTCDLALQRFIEGENFTLEHTVNLVCSLPSTFAQDPRLFTIIRKMNRVFKTVEELFSVGILGSGILKGLKLRNSIIKNCIKYGNEAITLTLVNHDIFIKNKDSRLLKAANKGFRNLCIALINKGANPNTENCIGHSPLYVALDHNFTDLALALLENGADPNFDSRTKLTALWMGCVRGNQQAVNALIEKGARLDTENAVGETALYWTCKTGHLDILKILISQGADPEKPNKYGHTPSYIARWHYHDELASYIEDHLAQKK